MTISIYKQPKEIQEAIIKDYQNNVSMRQLEINYGTTRRTISKFLTEKGIKTTVGNHYRKYTHQYDFFEKINTEEKAYWLGFMYADGWIVDNSNKYGQNQFGISLAVEDEAHVKKFLTSLKATNNINYDNSGLKRNQSRLAKVTLTSQKTVDDLISQGCFKKKTLILEPPKNIPENLVHHFIRGFFDGDGSIVKSSGKYFEKYGKYNYSVSFSCMEDIANWLQLYFGFGSVIKDKRKEYSYSYSIGGANCVEDFYHKLYDDATIYLDRKYNRFQEFLIQKYGESQGTNT